MKKEKIEQYKTWMDNLSFFDNHSFVIDNIENLWNLTNYIGYSFSKYIKYYQKENNTYSNINLNETITLAQDFFFDHNFNINVAQMIKDNTLIINEKAINKRNDFNGTEQDGISYYDENHNKVAAINSQKTINDSIVIIHELLHYLNQPPYKRNGVSDLLTEAISYGAELIFCEELKNKKYKEDCESHFKNIAILTYKYAYSIYNIYKIVYLYKEKNDITEEKYNELYNDNQYLNTMKDFEKYTELHCSIFRDTWYMIGLPLAIYLLEEYKKDKNNIKYIHILNENINKKDLKWCMNAIGINNISILKEKIKTSIENFKVSLDDIYLKQYNEKKDNCRIR